MPTIQLPADLRNRYEPLADRLDGFDSPDELAEYVLEATAEEIERGDTDSATDSADDEVVEDRLEQLGYLEK
ncbi:hypothetical protein [Halorussus lipolyticus]|uniref:hypothetical protein n=1 Tax=Halorussus lipolyticus TaxID=3034024 RepID=UPI0023E7E26C|nr:hypothetical protein [Halorussus sp. DT80]